MCESFKCPECGFEKLGPVAELLAWAKKVGREQAERDLMPLIAELQRKLQAELDAKQPYPESASVTPIKKADVPRRRA